MTDDIDIIREHHDEDGHFERLSAVTSWDIADEAAFLVMDRLLAAARYETELTAVPFRRPALAQFLSSVRAVRAIHHGMSDS